MKLLGARTQRERACDRSFGGIPVAFDDHAICTEIAVRLRKVGVQFQGFLVSLQGAWPTFVRRQQSPRAPEAVKGIQSAIAERVGRISVDGALKVVATLTKFLRGSFPPIVTAFEVELISLGTFRMPLS